MPEQIKAPLRDGGIRTHVLDELTEKADVLVAELKSGEAGRDRLLHDPSLAPGIKQQLENIPSRALRDPELIAGVANMFRDSLMANENALVAANVQQSLMLVKTGIQVYSKQLVERIQRGTKEAFATSIAHMMERALWIVALAVLVVLFVPELPLRARAQPESAAASEA